MKKLLVTVNTSNEVHVYVIGWIVRSEDERTLIVDYTHVYFTHVYLGKLVEVSVYLVLELGSSGEAILLCRATPVLNHTRSVP